MQDNNLELMFKAFNEIDIISQLSMTRVEKNFPLGIKASQFKVLNHLTKRGGESTPAKLAAAFQVTKGAMTNTLNRLLTFDLVRIEESSKDRRVKLVFITDKGREVQQQAVAVCCESVEPMLTEIGITEFEQALPFLTKLRVYLDAHRNE